MFCEHCGAQNPETTSYCRVCSKRMEGKRGTQQLRYGPLLSRRTALIRGAALVGLFF